MSASNSTKISKPSYLYSIISITLVLFMLGLLGVILLQAQTLVSHFKENIEITLILADGATIEETQALEARLSAEKYVKSAKYVSKEEAAQLFMQESGENFKDILDYNPLFSSINLFLHAKYANSDSLHHISQQIKENKLVEEVFYQEAMLDLINVNTGKVGFVLLVLSAIFLIIAFTLIDNTIKLAMYANRFLIKSMQLVGATRWFISAPFITQSVYNGIISGLLASVLLVLLLLVIQRAIPEFSVLHQPLSFVLLCAIVILIGIAISWWSTKQSVVKYLQSHLEELY
jgi:cell division transport system permease protein